MTAISALYPQVYPSVPGAPDVALLDAIRQASIEFAEKTHAWQDVLAGINIVANTHTYTIPTVTDRASDGIVDAWHDGQLLDPTSPDVLTANETNWTTMTGTPKWYYQPTQDVVRLVPNPTAALTAGLVLRVEFKPSQTATTIPDHFYNHYAKDIANGAIAALLMVPDKPWTNFKLAVAKRLQFDEAIASANVRSAKGFTKAPKRAVSRFL